MFFSLRTKFIIFISIAVLIFEFLFLFFALDLYEKDKSSFVLESAAAQSRSLSGLLSQRLDELRLISNYDFATIKEINLPKSVGVVDLEVFSKKDGRLFDLSKSSDLPLNETQFRKYLEQKTEILSVSETDGQVFATFARVADEKNLIVIKSDITALIESLKGGKTFSVFLFETSGNLLSAITQKGASDTLFISELKKLISRQGAFETAIDQVPYIVSVSPPSDLGLAVITTVPKSIALIASKALVKQTLGLGLIFTAISILGVIVFSRLVTRPIQELTSTAEEISLGNYDQNLQVRSRDEIGVLTGAFNKMVLEIKNYMNEMIKKDRIESEMQMAKSVQESLLPDSSIKNDHVDIAGFYSSASECGGDWWGCKTSETSTYLFISDATGHGLPASLLTASVSSCCETILRQMEDGDVTFSPSKFLQLINHVIYNSSDNLMMTMLVAKIDHLDNKVTIANASHEFPIIINDAGNVTIQTPAPGPRLGQNPNSHYQEFDYEFNKHDTLFLYTDGLIENQSAEEKPFGERKLLRTLKKISQNPQESREKVLTDYHTHTKERAPEDDVTFVFARRL
jgi:sigma-B regulation protein RsbU (phosphoserine phosphatase)